MKNSILTIDLGVLKENYKELFNEVHAGTAVVPVLKGNAYGLGALKVAAALEETGLVKYFAVSHVSEGVELRQITDKPIWVLSSPLSFQIDDAIDNDLTLTIGRRGILSLIDSAAGAKGKRASIQLKIETGLHRIGLAPGEEIAEFIKEYKNCGNVCLTGAFSHFIGEEPVTMEKQYDEYIKGVTQLEEAGIKNLIRHISCSASVELTDRYNLDAVRIGRRLYMDHPKSPTGKITEVCEYKSFLTAVHKRNKGETLGYGGKAVLDRDCTVGTVGIGYGDGYMTELCYAHAPVLINGKKCPLLGTCMDQSFVLLDGVDAEPDDEVIFFGQGLTSQEVAQTIGKEGCAITANLTGRVEKRYIE